VSPARSGKGPQAAKPVKGARNGSATKQTSSPTGTKKRVAKARPTPAEERLEEAFEGFEQVELAPLDAEPGVAAFLEALSGGEPWYPALLNVVARWVTPEERVDDATYRYLLGGEAFDWRRLAERLLDAAGELVPADEAERLLFDGKPPATEDASEEAFARAIGREKYRAHLNFQYGVTVEEALLLQAENELQKARSLEGPRGEPADVAAYERVYGKPFADLTAEYRVETGCALGEHVSQAEFAAFTYWCSKYRFRLAEPARVASDTRKALALLSRLEAERAPRERRRPDARPAEVIEL
jgi:hypothetical protein